MPRPKVRPEDRQRTYKACLLCKSSKIRCDSESPCASCVKRGRASSCVYSDVDRRRRHHNLPKQAPYRATNPKPDSSPDVSQIRHHSLSSGHLPDTHFTPAIETPPPSTVGGIDAPLQDQFLVNPNGEKGKDLSTLGRIQFA